MSYLVPTAEWLPQPVKRGVTVAATVPGWVLVVVDVGVVDTIGSSTRDLDGTDATGPVLRP